MIRDAKRPLLSAWWERYVRGALRRAFRGIWVRGALPADAAGVLLYANHSNYWDGFVVHLLTQRAGRDGYTVMGERQLKRYRFLTRLGAFSLRRGDPQSALQTFRHARRLLARPRAAVLLFPEGVATPQAPLPLRFERGIEVLSRWARGGCVPVALHFAFFEHALPDVLVDVGPSHPPAAAPVLARALTERVAALRATRSFESFHLLLRGRSSAAERWDQLRGLAT